MKIPLATSWLAVVVASITLTGCGGPPYNQAIKEKLEEKFKSVANVTSLKTEETAKTADTITVKFKATFTTREDMWESYSLWQHFPALPDAVKTMRNLPQDAQSTLNPQYDELTAVTFIKKASPKGTKMEAYGTAQAGRTIDKWEAEITSIDFEEKGYQEFTGNPKDEVVKDGQKWLDVETSEGKAALKDLEAKAAAFVKAVEDARTSGEKAAEAQQAEAKAKLAEIKETFLQGLVAGQTWQGQWEGSRGSAGTLILTVTELSNTGKVSGYLADPSNQNTQKFFDGQLSGNGNDKPFSLTISVVRGTGYSQRLFNQQSRWTNVNVLGEGQHYRLTLEYIPQSKTLKGTTSPDNMGRVEFSFGQSGSAPEGWGSSSQATPPSTNPNVGVSQPTDTYVPGPGDKFVFPTNIQPEGLETVLDTIGLHDGMTDSFKELTAAGVQMQQKIQQLANQGKTDQARKLVKELIQKYPASFSALLLQIEMEARDGNTDIITRNLRLISKYPIPENSKTMLIEKYGALPGVKKPDRSQKTAAPVAALSSSGSTDSNTITGTLQSLSKNGSSYLAIQLDQPVTTADEEGKQASSQIVQIAGLDETAWAAASKLVGKTVTCQGSLATPNTRYHFTPVLVITDSVSPATSGDNSSTDPVSSSLVEVLADGANMTGRDVELEAYVLASPGMIGETVMLTSTWPMVSNMILADYKGMDKEGKMTLLGSQGKKLLLKGKVRKAIPGEVGNFVFDVMYTAAGSSASGSTASGSKNEIIVFGQTYQINPAQLEGTSITWDQAKAFLPANITQPLTHVKTLQDAKNQVAKLTKAAGSIYQGHIDSLAASQPDPEKASSELAEKFSSNEGESMNPDAQKAHNTYIALMYVGSFLDQQK